MLQTWHVPKFIDLHVWGKYANRHVTYEAALNNGVARITVHRLMMTIMTMQDDGSDDATAQLLILTWPLG